MSSRSLWLCSALFGSFGVSLLAQPAPDTVAPAPPTPEQSAAWKASGRTLPTSELLQPTLDPALASFQPRAARDLAGSYRGASSDVLVELGRKWIAAFQKYYPAVKIELVPPFAGSLGAQELIAGANDFVLVSRELRPADIEGFTKKFGYDPFSVPISGGSYRHFGFLDAVAFFVHQDNPIRQLTFGQLDALLSTTHHRSGTPIRTWGQLGLTGEWADKAIHVVGVKPWNGFEEFVRQRVLSVAGKRGEWREDLEFHPTVFPISPRVAADRYAIGYAGVAYIGPGTKTIALAEKEGGMFYAASYDEVARARYPLSRVTFFNTNQAPGKPLPPALAEFVRFILSRDGQAVVRDQAIFLPLRAGQVAGSRKLVD
ncbi:MAG: phosphate ABC transporter substrate-binding protein, PhoT family [Opitutus sp.]|nr:phosphate ABC transporter substrate-binding protein, PhoT family [Opitutus sp.]